MIAGCNVDDLHLAAHLCPFDAQAMGFSSNLNNCLGFIVGMHPKTNTPIAVAFADDLYDDRQLNANYVVDTSVNSTTGTLLLLFKRVEKTVQHQLFYGIKASNDYRLKFSYGYKVGNPTAEHFRTVPFVNGILQSDAVASDINSRGAIILSKSYKPYSLTYAPYRDMRDNAPTQKLTVYLGRDLATNYTDAYDLCDGQLMTYKSRLYCNNK